MNHRFRLLAALLVFSGSPVRAEPGENPDFLRGVAIYQNGKGDWDAFPSALEAFKLAAEKGHTGSQYFLGRMYHLGDGVSVNLDLAARWYLLAAEKGHSTAWNNLGNVYGALGKPEKMILGAFSRSSELGDALGSFNMGSVLHGGYYGVRINRVRALEYYHKTLQQQPDYPKAWGSIGNIHASGGAGVKADPKAAEDAYFSGIRASEDSYCYYMLYQLYSDGDMPPRDMPALAYLEKAAEKGHGEAADIAARISLKGWDGAGPDLVKTAHFYDLSARAGSIYSASWLSERANVKELVEHYGKETTKAWSERWENLNKGARKEVDANLAKVRPVFAAGEEQRANAMLDEALDRWISRSKDNSGFLFTSQTWNVGQTDEGRNDLEWGRFLFAWLIPIYERNRDANLLLGAISNFDEKVRELGRYGLLRESSMRTKKILRDVEGIEIDAVRKSVSVGPDFTIIGAEKIPLQLDLNASDRSRRSRYNHRIPRGEPFSGIVMREIVDLAYERMTVGDWQSALVFSEWVIRWSDKIAADKTDPNRDYPGGQAELQMLPYALKADVFSALGLPEMAAAACQAIIDNKPNHWAYGGRDFSKAQYQQAGFLVDQNASEKVDLENLKKVEDHMRDNEHDQSHAWQFAKLVRARVLAVREGIDAARPLVREVLISSAESGRPLQRLEALLTSADLELKAGKTEGVEANLEEALAWARKQGLLIAELRAVELYVTYLLQTGNYDQALVMQRRVLELIDAMHLFPRRERAVLLYAQIHALRNDKAAALALLEQVKSPELSSGVETVRKMLARGDASPSVTLRAIDLQPMRIQSMPLSEEAEAVFMLANPNPARCPVEMTFTSGTFGLTLQENSPEELAVQASTSQNSSNQSLVAKVEVPGNGQLPITLSAKGLGSLNGDASVTFQAKTPDGTDLRKSEWLIQPKGSDVAVAVVDAAQLRNSAFYLIPVYHHLDSLDGAKKTAAVRVTASEPTRVEGYATDGTLLFVDAQGNGSFRDPGDLIATSEVDGLFPILNTGAETGRIGLRYQPESRGSNGRVELRIETREPGAKGDWKTDAIDWLEP